VSYPSEAFGILRVPFQWIETLKSQNLVFDWYHKTRKPGKIGNQNQYEKYQSIFLQAQFQEVKFGFSEI
jgi:hypothetical protein